jgi:hypothetical protein
MQEEIINIFIKACLQIAADRQQQIIFEVLYANLKLFFRNTFKHTHTHIHTATR